MFKKNFFNGLMAKFKKQYLPVRDSKLGIYLPTGDIAKAVKPETKGDDVEEYRVFINGQLTTVPAGLVTTSLPVYRIDKPISQLKVGDIIRTGNDSKFTYRRVSKISGDKIVTDTFNGTTDAKVVAISDLLLGSKTVSVAINLMQGFNLGGTAGIAANPMVLAALSDDEEGGEDSLLETIMMLQFMGGNGAGIQGNNLLPLLLMSKGGESGGTFENLMMMQMLGNGQNPFTNLFCTPVTTAPAEPAAETPDAEPAAE